MSSYRGILQVYLFHHHMTDLKDLDIVYKGSENKIVINDANSPLPDYYIHFGKGRIDSTENLMIDLENTDYDLASNLDFTFLETRCGDDIIQEEISNVGVEDFLNETSINQIIKYIDIWKSDKDKKSIQRPIPIHLLVNICYNHDGWTGEYDIDYEAFILDLYKINLKELYEK